MRRFRDREEAGRLLGEALSSRYCGDPDVVVLGLPRGGIPVAHEVARRLAAPLDVFLVRKLGVPGHEELAMGAISTGGTRVLNNEVVHGLNVPSEVIDAVVERERAELERRERAYRGDRPAPDVHGRTVILVDDGLATGSTMRAAAEAVHAAGPSRVIVAVPVGAPETCDALRAEADEVVCLVTPDAFRAVGMWYDDFRQTSDDEVRAHLADARSPANGRAETGRSNLP
ncbi:MAG: phosphoribosyltransferase [Longimicrobiales bacterium]